MRTFLFAFVVCALTSPTTHAQEPKPPEPIYPIIDTVKTVSDWITNQVHGRWRRFKKPTAHYQYWRNQYPNKRLPNWRMWGFDRHPTGVARLPSTDAPPFGNADHVAKQLAADPAFAKIVASLIVIEKEIFIDVRPSNGSG